MENASKALIMAAAVLVAIMIIALGVTIFNKAKGSSDTTSLDTAEITMFNQKFERFAGDNVSGSNVKSLLSFAISNAGTNRDNHMKLPQIIIYPYDIQTEDTSHRHATAKGADAQQKIEDYINAISSFRKGIKSTNKYSIDLSYSEAGIVNTVTIKLKI